MKKIFWVATLVFVLSTLTIATVSAQGSTPTDDEVNAIARQLYCPVCENTPLDVCPTDACKEWREEKEVTTVVVWHQISRFRLARRDAALNAETITDACGSLLWSPRS